MSIQAMNWVLEEAPLAESDRHLFPVLMALANAADEDGRGAFPSQATVSWQTRKTERSVRSDLRALESRGVIRRGDQARAVYLPADRRPVVYDLAMERSRDMSQRPTKRHPSGTNVPRTGRKSSVDRAEVERQTGGKPTAPRSQTGRKSSVDRAEVQRQTGGKPTSADPSFNPSINPSSSLATEAVAEREEEETSPEKTSDERPEALELIRALPQGTGISATELAPYVAGALAAGWHPRDLRRELTRDHPRNVSSLTGLYIHRLKGIGKPVASDAATPACAAPVGHQDPADVEALRNLREDAIARAGGLLATCEARTRTAVIAALKTSSMDELTAWMDRPDGDIQREHGATPSKRRRPIGADRAETRARLAELINAV